MIFPERLGPSSLWTRLGSHSARHLVSLHSASLRLVFPLSLLLKVGTSNPLLNLLNGAKPIYQLTHFRWIIYPFILSDNAADVTRGTEAVFRGDIRLFLALFHCREEERQGGGGGGGRETP